MTCSVDTCPDNHIPLDLATCHVASLPGEFKMQFWAADLWPIILVTHSGGLLINWNTAGKYLEI